MLYSRRNNHTYAYTNQPGCQRVKLFEFDPEFQNHFPILRGTVALISKVHQTSQSGRTDSG